MIQFKAKSERIIEDLANIKYLCIDLNNLSSKYHISHIISA